MNSKQILITNDDGIQDQGLEALVEIMSTYGQVYVVAPAINMSATSHGMTLDRPLKAKNLKLPHVELAISLDGTPADCVKYATTFLNLKPNLVISGINNEANVGTDILYSGTVSAAIEANLLGYPAMAVSTAAPDYESVKDYLPTILKKWFSQSLDPKITLNLNFPVVRKPKGIEITTVGVSTYEHVYTEENGGHRLSGVFIDLEQPEETDVKTLLRGYISLSPLKVQLEDKEKMAELKKWF